MSLSEWQETSLGDHINFRNGKSSPQRGDNLPHPVYGSNGVIGRANITNTEDRAIVVGRVGSFCGSLYFSRSPAWVTDNAIIAEAKDNNDLLFFFYLLTSLNLNHLKAGSGQPLINQSILSSIKVSTPAPHEQKAIAAVLGALDDKIELNRRMNATLEAMARALFKSWFVDFDPVRAKMEGKQPFGMAPETAALFPSRLVTSELGDIPEGWKIGAITEIVHLNPSTTIQKNATAPYLDMAALPVVGSWPDAPIQRVVSSGSRFKNGDTLLARITPCLENGKTAFVSCLQEDIVGWGSTEFIVLRPRPPVPSEYGYILARLDSFRAHAIQSMTGTSGRQRVQVESLGRYLLPIPDKKIFMHFGKQVAPLFKKIQSNAKENEGLTKTRDYLLPKLISGDIRIPDAEKLWRRHEFLNN